jgi:glyoxylase-like metal-dependent hydrolase (beta-lactamase superfamily II)
VALGMADFIDAHHEIAPGITTEPSHGHTPGHVHVCIESAGSRAVITGDLMHHPMQCAVPHRDATFDMDKDAGRASRIGFVEKYRDSGVLVIGAHWFDPTAGHIETGPDGETWFHGLGL